MSQSNINSTEKSVCAIYDECFDKFRDEKCIGEVNTEGKIDFLTFGEVRLRVEAILEHLTSECSLENSQDTKIGFYTTNNLPARLFYTSLFTSKIVSVPVYPALGLKNILAVFSQTGINALVCDSENRISEVLSNKSTLPQLKFIFFCGKELDSQSKERLSSLETKYEVVIVHVINMISNPQKTIPKLDSDVMASEKPVSTDIAVLLPTSGTTGEPKIAMMSHLNLHSCVIYSQNRHKACIDRIFKSKNKKIVFYAILPEQHTIGQLSVLMMHIFGGLVIYPSSPNLKEVLLSDLAAVKPTVLAMVPLLLERFHDKISKNLESKPLINFAVSFSLRWKEKFPRTFPLDFLFKKVRSLFGGNLRFVLVGGAPLNAETMNFFKLTTNSVIVQGYGMTEGILSVQTENDTGCNVGKPLECMQVKFFEAKNEVIENTGANNSVISYEIGMKGDCLCSGYYKNADLYANSFKDGYFLTGDIGYEDENKNIVIVDRKKDIFKISNGEYIIPHKIEKIYCAFGPASFVFVFAKSTWNSIVGIAFLDHAELLNWLKSQKTLNLEDLNSNTENLQNELNEKNSEIGNLVKSELCRIGRREKLLGFEQVKSWILDLKQPTTENNFLTPTFKLKRNVIQCEKIEALTNAYLFSQRNN